MSALFLGGQLGFSEPLGGRDEKEVAEDVTRLEVSCRNRHGSDSVAGRVAVTAGDPGFVGCVHPTLCPPRDGRDSCAGSDGREDVV